MFIKSKSVFCAFVKNCNNFVTENTMRTNCLILKALVITHKWIKNIKSDSNQHRYMTQFVVNVKNT